MRKNFPSSCGISTPIHPSPHHPGVGGRPSGHTQPGSRASPAAGVGDPSCRSTGMSGRRRPGAAQAREPPVPAEEGVLPRGQAVRARAPSGGQPLHALLGKQGRQPRGLAEAGKKAGLARGRRLKAAGHWRLRCSPSVVREENPLKSTECNLSP